MEVAAPPKRAPRTVIARGQRLLLATLVLLTVGAWALTVHQAQTMDMPMGIALRGAADSATGAAGVTSAATTDTNGTMSAMAMDEHAPIGVQTTVTTGMSGMAIRTWTWHGLATFFVAWTVMMIAMMFPAAAPMVVLYHRMVGQRGSATNRMAPTWIFLGGYLLVWSTAGALTWVLVQIGIGVGSRLGAADRATWAPVALGGTLLVAAAYQLTPLKERCLRQCQSPVSFVMAHWRKGNRGALGMGFMHGAYCLGCCWALFAVLVAAGVMSLAWMLLLTAVVFAEKVLPLARWTPRAVGVAFAALGVLVAAGALDMPWLA